MLIHWMVVVQVSAEEGMWLPQHLGDYVFARMQEMGLQLDREDLTGIGTGGVTDAVVSLGGFCTAAVISDEGLIITNHHCGLRTIQEHSTLASNYLEEGFWAMDRSEELQNPGLYVRFLRYAGDVTKEVLGDIDPEISDSRRNGLVNKNIGIIQERVRDTSDLIADVRAFNQGTEYWLLLYEEFNDVRLVGAPPVTIGRFGGNTDNWVWPRHTGDFSLLRIYADTNNNPAFYSPDNVPYRPEKYLEISLRGFDEDDFTLIAGFPGTTSQYLVSTELEWLLERSLPAKVAARRARVEVMEEHMVQDEKIALMYASKYSSASNYFKKWMGQLEGTAKSDVLLRKKTVEETFSEWAEQEESGKYAGLVDSIDRVLGKMQEISLLRDFESEVVRSIEIIRFASGFGPLQHAWAEKDTANSERILTDLVDEADGFYRDYSAEIDREIAARMLGFYARGMPVTAQPDLMTDAGNRYDGDYTGFVEWLFDESILVKPEEAKHRLEHYDDMSWVMIENDKIFRLAREFETIFSVNDSRWNILNRKRTSLYRRYIEGLRIFSSELVPYPDANRSMRLTYGKVEGYRPRDAMRYGYLTSLKGIIEKDNMELADYVVPDYLRELYDKGDFGEYGMGSTMPVCFLASNHTTNGNSGSPVMDAWGRLIGVNFDRNWEGTISDFTYNGDNCRNISVDIRYVLFIIDRFAGAGYLLEEMDIIR